MALPNVVYNIISSNLLFYPENSSGFKSKFDCVGLFLLSSRNVLECSGTQDSKEILQSPPSRQTKGEKSGQRLSHSFRPGELPFEHSPVA